jgi:hypothetical protein
LLLAAVEEGGGIYMESDARAILQHCTFTGNTAFFGGGVFLSNTSAGLYLCLGSLLHSMQHTRHTLPMLAADTAKPAIPFVAVTPCWLASIIFARANQLV